MSDVRVTSALEQIARELKRMNDLTEIGQAQAEVTIKKLYQEKLGPAVAALKGEING